MRKLAVLTILGIIALSGCGEETIILPGEDQNQIRVVGTATVKTPPDIATAQIGVQTSSEEVEAAVAENNSKTEAVIAALRQQGIAEKDIQTSRFNIYPQRDYKNDRPEVIIGFQVDNTVSVKFRDLTSIGKSLQAAITAGANDISGVSFTLDDPSSIRDDARVKAIQDARKQAESMAQAADVELGKVISIDEMSYGGPIVARADYDQAAIKSEVPIQPGELELTVQVQVVFAIAE